MVHPEVEESRKKGNECVKEKKYIEAMLHYTQGIKHDPKNHLLYSNRSLAFLKMDQFYHAMEDACKVIELQPSWPKGYFRKGEVECKTEHYNEALASYRTGLLIDSDDIGLQEAASRVAKLLKEQKTREGRIPMYGLTFGILFGAFIILGDEFLTKKPTLNHIILKIIVFAAVAAFGLYIAKAYRYFLRSQRDSLLDAPIDLFTGEKEKSTIPKPNSNAEQAEDVNIPSSKPRRSGTAAGRQRYKMGKT